ncbi:MAG: DUF4105 domain-containing protein [Opitutales bacterium]|nr:DUF4105 domain-containing protein [Opitutales bacterium]
MMTAPPGKRRRIVGLMRWLCVFSAIVLLAWLAFRLAVQPSNDRNWIAEHAVLPEITFTENGAHIRHIRSFRHHSREKATPGYSEDFFAFDDVAGVDFVVEPFSGFKGAAHTFVTFGFADGRHLSFSVEARREIGEHYSVWRGALRQYELMMVIADEQDILSLRAVHRGNDVFLYPIRADRAQVAALFERMLRRTDQLAREPEFYHTVVSNCTSNIIREVNALVPGRIPLHVTWLLPENADRFAHELGLIDTELPFPEARARHRINAAAALHVDDADFSARIRTYRAAEKP